MNKVVIQQIAIYIIGGVALYFLAKKLLDKLVPDFSGEEKKEEQKDAVQSVLASRMFDPAYWRTVNASRLMSMGEAETLATQIHDAWGWFNDDEDEIANALVQAANWPQISQITDAYSNLFNQDLFTVFAKNLNAHEINLLWNLLKNKPHK